ncbi:hypothetical protein IEQ34_026140 [Dendrobium chrysotoxum]|uniref:Uncharacterized protein n=1 Tax=Dendrobium chrysotoxum TaxID=161865 RepID=A0AAV7FN52_DENCH|nr:hypothetical protein IEQ34_026140 [Dendrobium chrysotoxum]
MGSPRAVAMGTREPWKARQFGACCVGRPPRRCLLERRSPRAPAVGKACNDPRLEPSSGQDIAIPLRAETHRRPPSASLPQFQALFDSLFKVLFIFPSRYLSLSVLSPVFSLGRNLAPDRAAFPNNPDSPTTPRVLRPGRAERGSHPPPAPIQGTWQPVRR